MRCKETEVGIVLTTTTKSVHNKFAFVEKKGTMTIRKVLIKNSYHNIQDHKFCRICIHTYYIQTKFETEVGSDYIRMHICIYICMYEYKCM